MNRISLHTKTTLGYLTKPNFEDPTFFCFGIVEFKFVKVTCIQKFDFVKLPIFKIQYPKLQLRQNGLHLVAYNH